VETGNSAVRFFNAYTRATAPIANYPEHNNLNEIKTTGISRSDKTTVELIEGTTTAFKYAASLGTLRKTADNSPVTNIIQEIRIFHVYNFGNHVNVYKYFNPRIMSMSLDDLDMSIGNEGSELSLSFNYDTMYIDTGVPMADISSKLAAIQSNALYPLRNNVSKGGNPGTPTSVKPFGTPATVQDKCSPAINTSNPPIPSAATPPINGFF
jgi:hypothetical protein